MPLISQVWADWNPRLEGPCTEVKKKKSLSKTSLETGTLSLPLSGNGKADSNSSHRDSDSIFPGKTKC